MLLLSGDIETNPGPDLQDIYNQVCAIATDIKEIKEKRLPDIDKKLDALSALEAQVTTCQNQLCSMNKLIAVLENKIDHLENQSRRSNLIVYGLAEVDNETSETLEQKVSNEIIRNIMELKEPIAIERIHRLGRPEAGKIRPVIFKLLDWRDKSLILKNGFKLKDTALSIGEDFSRRIREVRKQLWPRSKIHRDKGEKVYMAFDKLYIDGQAHVWDNEAGDIKPIAQSSAASKTRPVTRSQTQPPKGKKSS